jgi:hypothetical protein
VPPSSVPGVLHPGVAQPGICGIGKAPRCKDERLTLAASGAPIVDLDPNSEYLAELPVIVGRSGAPPPGTARVAAAAPMRSPVERERGMDMSASAELDVEARG